MARASDNVLFEDIFEIQEKDPDGKKFDRGERLPRSARCWIAAWAAALLRRPRRPRNRRPPARRWPPILARLDGALRPSLSRVPLPPPQSRALCAGVTSTSSTS
jgi:hypothetical protein